MKALRKSLVLLLMAAMLTGVLPQTTAQAATKPAKPVIKLEILKNGTDVKITIKTTTGATGYKIVMKAPGQTKYKSVKTLKKDGTAVRAYTVKDLSAGEYSFKVKAYTKSGGKTVYGSYSKAKSVTIGKQATLGKITEFSKAKTGDYITFGAYEQDNNLKNGKEPIEWLVLSNTGKELYVVSKYALDCKPYNEISVAMTWENCTLRKWLNEDFYKAAFSTAEQSVIKTTTVKNDDNPEHGTDGGNDTKDKVFLPSIADMVNTDYGFIEYYYYDDEEKMISRRCAPTAYAEAQGVPEGYYNKTTAGDDACSWWLRSPGAGAGLEDYYAALVDSSGYVDTGGVEGCCVNIDDACIGLRPALVINLK